MQSTQQRLTGSSVEIFAVESIIANDATMRSSSIGGNLSISQRHFSVSLILVALWVHTVPVAAFTKYFFFCSLSNRPIVYLNATMTNSGRISFTEVSDNNNGEERRLLRSRSHNLTIAGAVLPKDSHLWKNHRTYSSSLFRSKDVNNEDEESVPAVRLTTEASDGASSLKSGRFEVLEFRRCPCTPRTHYDRGDFYCPADLGYCAISGSYHSNPEDPVCLNIQSEEIFVRSIWPIILIWFALTFTFCICTWAGKNACDFILSTFCPCWNKLLFEAICARPQDDDQDNNNDRRRGFLRRMVIRRRRYIQDRYRAIVGRARGSEPGNLSHHSGGSEYELRTRIFRREKKDISNENKDQDEPVPEQHQETIRDANENGLSIQPVDNDDVNDGETSSEDQHSPSCAICFLTLEEGDRVGAIDCEHLFHVDCLKGWLTRRNVCPLCLQEGIAKPKGQYGLQQRRSISTNTTSTTTTPTASTSSSPASRHRSMVSDDDGDMAELD